MQSKDDLDLLANAARRLLEPGLQVDLVGQPVSDGSCLYAALLVVMLMARYGSGRATVRGGGPNQAGARDVGGALRGHYWVEVQTPDGGEFVVDVTADQFGFEPVVVLPLKQSRERYLPGPQDEVDAAFTELAEEFGCRDLIAV